MSLIFYVLIAMMYRYELRDVNVLGNEYTDGEVRDAVMGALLLYVALGVLIYVSIPFRPKGRRRTGL